MTCRDAQDRDLAERYCLKQLPDEQAAEYEDHYFECQACYAELRAVQEARQQLAAKPVAVMPPPRAQYRWLSIAAGCVLALSSAVWFATRPVADPYPELARVDPPAYRAVLVRGAGEAGGFAEAMQAYQAARYAEALTALDAVARAEPDNAAAFYAAACELAMRHPAEAARRFAAVAARGESRFQEPAYWFEAKAWIGVRNRAQAEQALRKLVALQGDQAAEGQQLLEKLAALR